MASWVGRGGGVPQPRKVIFLGVVSMAIFFKGFCGDEMVRVAGGTVE